MRPNIKEEHKDTFRRRMTLIKLFGMFGKKKNSVELQQFLQQVKKLEDFLRPLLGYDKV